MLVDGVPVQCLELIPLGEDRGAVSLVGSGRRAFADFQVIEQVLGKARVVQVAFHLFGIDLGVVNGDVGFFEEEAPSDIDGR